MENNIELSGDETLLWSGKPKQGMLFTTQDFFLLPFSMFGCGFGYFLITMPSFIDVSEFVAWIGWIFLVLSIYFTLFRFSVDASYRSRLFYALSNENVYFQIGKTVKKYNLSEFKRIKCDSNDDSSGIIWFEPQTTVQMLLGNSFSGLPFYKHPKAFMFIPQVKSVFEILRELKSKKN